MRKFLAFIVSLAAFSLLPACAQLGLQKAQSLDQQIAYGYSTLGSVRSTTADLLIAKTIKKDDAIAVQNMANTVRSFLDIGQGAVKDGRPKDAQAALNLANSVLTQIQTYLAARKGGG